MQHSKVITKLNTSLKNVNYGTKVIIISDLLKQFKEYQKDYEKEDERINFLMDAGNDFREKLKTGEALGILAINRIREIRQAITKNEKAIPRVAFILKSLKHPSEVSLFRYVYGSSFSLISIYSPRDLRVDKLTKKIMHSHGDHQEYKFRAKAEELVARDESEIHLNEYGQNVRDTYPKADVFIDTQNPGRFQSSLERFIRLIFGDTSYIPTNDEFGMFNAFASAKRSRSLARQVGASITNDYYDLISTGTNEVPKFGGGHYTADQENDTSNFGLGYDSSDVKKTDLLKDMLRKLNELKLLKDSLDDTKINELIFKIRPMLRNTQIMNILEFNREVHAEMDAIITAARNTISIRNCTLFTTTFPCHDCTKHIVAAGIKRVVYIEPYPKSLASDLYAEFISIDVSGTEENKVKFEPYVGVVRSFYYFIYELIRGNIYEAINRIPYDSLPYIRSGGIDAPYYYNYSIGPRSRSGFLSYHY
jgi:deoxycytidylate deaminase